MSTVSSGNEFRDLIQGLVKLAGWQSATERTVGGKRSDILFRGLNLGRTVTLALEAKNYSGALGQSELEKIVGGYVAAQQTKEIDELWIVAPQELKGGKDYLEKLNWVRFFTQQTLLSALMGFGSYLNDIIIDHEDSGLESYYVSPQARLEERPLEQFELIQYLTAWIQGDDRRPLAVVEGYGTGKTSIARHLAYSLAKQYLDGSTGRIPIYIELGRLTSQQRLAGLVSTLFTNDHLVSNFSYRLFRRMNAIGSFLIMFDGFDEMKHLMTPSDFEYNFKQLNELVEGNARVILLGRPSAFSSGDERQYLLHGRGSLDGQVTQDPAMPNYIELRIQPFTKEQVIEFVGKFLRYKAAHVAPGAQTLSEEAIVARIEEISSHDYGDLLERPVQARMLAELATIHSKPLGQLTRFTLYKRFMDELINREMEKEARQRFRNEIRRTFTQELSWWMWGANQTLGIRLPDIPDTLFTSYQIPGVSPAAVRRDLVAGSFLDHKGNDLFIVPHRSMIEFSVAEHVIGKIGTGKFDANFLREAWRSLSPDVISFVLECDDDLVPGTLVKALETYQGNLSNTLLEQLARSDKVIEAIRSIDVGKWSPWHIHLLSLGAQDRDKSNSGRGWTQFLNDVRSYLHTHRSDAAAFCAAVLTSLPFSRHDRVGEAAIGAIIGFFLEFGDLDALAPISEQGRSRMLVIDTTDLSGKTIDAFRRSILGVTASGTLFVDVSAAELGVRLGNHLFPRYSLDDAPRGQLQSPSAAHSSWPMPNIPLIARFAFNDFRTEALKDPWEVLRRYLTTRPKVVTKAT